MAEWYVCLHFGICLVLPDCLQKGLCQSVPAAAMQGRACFMASPAAGAGQLVGVAQSVGEE